MAKKQILLLPKAQRLLKILGENIKLARLRRKFTAAQVAERANIGRSTLWKNEEGQGSVAMGNYLQVLIVLGLEQDLALVAQDDVLGRKLQDLSLTIKKRGPKIKN